MHKFNLPVLILALAILVFAGCSSNRDLLLQKDAEIASLQKQVDDLQGNLQVARERAELLQNDLDSLAEHEKLIVKQLDSKTLLRIPDNLMFSSGSATISLDGKRIIDGIADVLSKYPEYEIRVEGHTDNKQIKPEFQDNFKSNWELSTARATEVVRYLISKHNLDPNRLSALGYGEYKAISENDTSEGRAQNRRVEFYFVPQLNVKDLNTAIEEKDLPL